MNGTDLKINGAAGSPLKTKEFIEMFFYTIVLAAFMAALAFLFGFKF